MKLRYVFLILALCFFGTVSRVRAEYVLPYPSFMPGNKIYRITRFLDTFESYWYFGAIAQFRYHLKLADKYLVEAKTLFEYKQYLLAADALTRSDSQFGTLPLYLKKITKEGVNVSTFSNTITDAALKHKDVLSDIKVPENFVWTPEKTAPVSLDLGSMIQSSITIRDSVASAAAGN